MQATQDKFKSKMFQLLFLVRAVKVPLRGLYRYNFELKNVGAFFVTQLIFYTSWG